MYSFPCSPTIDSPAYRELMDGKAVAFCADLEKVGASADVTSFSLHAASTTAVKLEFFCSSVLKEPVEDLVWEPCDEIPSISVEAGGNVFVQQPWNTTKRFLAVRATPADKRPTVMAMSVCFGSANQAMFSRGSKKLRSMVVTPRTMLANIFTPSELDEYIQDGFLKGKHTFGDPEHPEANYIYDVDTGQALEFAGASWVSTGKSISDVFGSGVKVRNPFTNRVYKT